MKGSAQGVELVAVGRAEAEIGAVGWKEQEEAVAWVALGVALAGPWVQP